MTGFIFHMISESVVCIYPKSGDTDFICDQIVNTASSISFRLLIIWYNVKTRTYPQTLRVHVFYDVPGSQFSISLHWFRISQWALQVMARCSHYSGVVNLTGGIQQHALFPLREFQPFFTTWSVNELAQVQYTSLTKQQCINIPMEYKSNSFTNRWK